MEYMDVRVVAFMDITAFLGTKTPHRMRHDGAPETVLMGPCPAGRLDVALDGRLKRCAESASERFSRTYRREHDRAATAPVTSEPF
jgi:hypothetical protein